MVLRPPIARVLAVHAVLVVAALAAQEPQLVDRVVAVVDEDPILLSEVERVIGLGLHETVAGESASATK